MFGSLKKKLKESIKVFSRKVEEDPEEEVVKDIAEEEVVEEKKEAPKKRKIFRRKPEKKEKKEPDEKEEEAPAEDKEEITPKEGILKRVRKKVSEKKLSEDDFSSIFEGLEMSLLESSVAFEVINQVKQELKTQLVDQSVKRGRTEDEITRALEKAFDSVLMEPKVPKFTKKPITIMFVGVNGAGKTTSLAKFCRWLQKKKKKCVLAASDTFRAASIEQLEKHASKLGVKIIKHNYGSDAAAVAFDAVEHAKSKGIDVVLIDTAGRSHANVNLMDELKKIKRVAKPDYTFFVGDSLVGNDAVEQAESFNEAVGIDFSILSKADVDQKGGAILSVAYVTKKPILFLGTGQNYDDLEVFDKAKILKRIF
jgi:fused signal recognition particle receptor